MSNSGRSRNNVDTRLIGFPPRTTMRGGNNIAILRHLYLPAPIGNAGTGAKAIRSPERDALRQRRDGVKEGGGDSP